MAKRTKPLYFKLRGSTRATFDAQAITSDAGVVLLRSLDDKLGLTKRLAASLPDTRSGPVVHSMLDFVRGRVLASAQGYEDCNDFNALRTEPLFMAVNDRLEGDPPLPSQPTLSRF
jgi:Transposase DDE domain group 1